MNSRIFIHVPKPERLCMLLTMTTVQFYFPATERICCYVNVYLPLVMNNG